MRLAMNISLFLLDVLDPLFATRFIHIVVSPLRESATPARILFDLFFLEMER